LAGQFGCSVKASGATIQEICGSVPAATSALRMSKNPPPLLTSVPVRAFS